MKDLNNVLLSGKVKTKKELAITKTGKHFCKSVLNVSNDNKSTYVNVTMWNDVAKEFDAEIKEGSKVIVEGRIDVSSYQAKDGTNKYDVYVTASKYFIINEEKAIEDYDVGGNDANTIDWLTTDPKKDVEEELANTNPDDLPF